MITELQTIRFHRRGLSAMRSQSLQSRRKIIAKIPLFSALDDRELDGLVRYSQPLSLAKGETLFHKGDSGSEVYVILSGRLKASSTSENASDVLFSLMDSGEVCGELALLSGATRSATVVAIEPCQLVALGRREFLQFLAQQPDAATKLLATLAERLQRVSQLVEDTVFLNLPARLAKKLLALADSYGRPVDGGMQIGLSLSQQDLGDMVGTTRESINKQVGAWRDEGVLSMERGTITIRRTDVLESLAGFVFA